MTGKNIALAMISHHRLNTKYVEEKTSSGGAFYLKSNTVMLSPSLAAKQTAYSAAVAAHEVGHAVQFSKIYHFIGYIAQLMLKFFGLVFAILLYFQPLLAPEMSQGELISLAETTRMLLILTIIAIAYDMWVEFDASIIGMKFFKHLNITDREYYRRLFLGPTITTISYTLITYLAVKMIFAINQLLSQL